MTKSRGIMNPIPIAPGVRFGKLTVIEKAKTTVHGSTRWLCVCDCGREKSVFSIKLRNGRTRSCSYRKTYSLQERFDRYIIPEPNSGCLLWYGTANNKGYGQIMSDKGQRLQLASHAALELAGITVPKGSFVCHHCDNPHCVNADHLYIGTPKQNTADMIRRGRARNQFSRVSV